MRDGPIWLAALVVLSLGGSLIYLYHKGRDDYDHVDLAEACGLTDADAPKPTHRSFYISILGRSDDPGRAFVHCGDCDEYLFARSLLPLDQAQQEAHIHAWEHEIGAAA